MADFAVQENPAAPIRFGIPTLDNLIDDRVDPPEVIKDDKPLVTRSLKDALERIRTGQIKTSQFVSRISEELIPERIQSLAACLTPMGKLRGFGLVERQNDRECGVYTYRANFERGTLFPRFTVTPKGEISRLVYPNDFNQNRGLKVQHGGAASLCILGPDGTGKSLLAMHLAARYAADCRHWQKSRGRPLATKVLYVSTDLKEKMAQGMWQSFLLDFPNRRTVPFLPEPLPYSHYDVDFALPLKPYRAPGAEEDADSISTFLQGERDEVAFIDLASYTAGDDWGFISRLLAMLEHPGTYEPRHLMLIDAVEGFETLVGETDAFGQVTSRRARIVQVMRVASEKCHIGFIVEEPPVGQRVPEEFVADLVVRLRSSGTARYARRTIEVEKVRGQSHVRGQHPLVIRKGTGSTTGKQANWDDPVVPVKDCGDRKTNQSYIHVFHSLDRLSRQIMDEKGEGRPSTSAAEFAAFGIRYLDDMLEGNAKAKRAVGDDFDPYGLQCSTATGLVGDPLTQKTRLGMAWLSRALLPNVERFLKVVEELSENRRGERRALEEVFSEIKKAFRRDGLQVPADLMKRDWARLRRLIETVSGKLTYDVPIPEICRDPETNAIEFARSLLGCVTSRGVAVLLTTKDMHADSLSENFVSWLLKSPDLGRPERFKSKQGQARLQKIGSSPVFLDYIKDRIICRRLEIHDEPSAVLMHIVQQAIRKAQQWVFPKGEVPHGKSVSRFHKSGPIRLVIDDLKALRDMYPGVRDDPLFLPFLLFHLGREGVTSLIIETGLGQPEMTGRPEIVTPGPLFSELRTLVLKCIHTWSVNFYGEDRIAITTIPPLSKDAPSLVRDLRWAFGQGERAELPLVDPHFELYTGLEEGKPRPVPLQVRLFSETPASTKYFEQENVLLCDLFTPLETNGPIVVGVDEGGYDSLRDFSCTQRDTRLDYSFVFQIDEFWALPHYEPVRLRPQWDYLNEQTVDNAGKREAAADPFSLFQVPGEKVQSGQEKRSRSRREFFTHGGHRLDENELDRDGKTHDVKSSIDRVPFTWDFGFLLCREQLWERAFNEKLNTPELKNDPPTVEEVWKSLPAARPFLGESVQESDTAALKRLALVRRWRTFFEACKRVRELAVARLPAPENVPAFDLALLQPESFSCLVLEIWGSEIYDDNSRFRERWKGRPGDRWWRPAKSGLIQMIEKNPVGLFKALLLLAEVFESSRLIDPAQSFEFRATKASQAAVASRHWYKTACTQTEGSPPDEILVAKRLPGHYSVRGDWFLAAAFGSRSGRLVDRALDILSSRRASLSRLQLGLGLPTRDVLPLGNTGEKGDDGYKQLRTKLVLHHDKGKPVSVTYGQLKDIGENTEDEFYWLWRSRLGFYLRHARIWQKWLNRMFIEFDRLRSMDPETWLGKPRRGKGSAVYKDCFQLYDAVNKEVRQGQNWFQDLSLWKVFDKMVKFLRAELDQATLPPQP